MKNSRGHFILTLVLVLTKEIKPHNEYKNTVKYELKTNATENAHENQDW